MGLVWLSVICDSADSSLLSTEDWNHYQAFVLATVSGVIGLFPLLFNAAGEWPGLPGFCGQSLMAETPVKLGYSAIYAVIVFSRLRSSVSKWAHSPLISPRSR